MAEEDIPAGPPRTPFDDSIDNIVGGALVTCVAAGAVGALGYGIGALVGDQDSKIIGAIAGGALGIALCLVYGGIRVYQDHRSCEDHLFY